MRWALAVDCTPCGPDRLHGNTTASTWTKVSDCIVNRAGLLVLGSPRASTQPETEMVIYARLVARRTAYHGQSTQYTCPLPNVAILT